MLNKVNRFHFKSLTNPQAKLQVQLCLLYITRCGNKSFYEQIYHFYNIIVMF